MHEYISVILAKEKNHSSILIPALSARLACVSPIPRSRSDENRIRHKISAGKAFLAKIATGNAHVISRIPWITNEHINKCTTWNEGNDGNYFQKKK